MAAAEVAPPPPGHTTNKGILNAEIMLEVAEIEGRLRRHVLELLEPTIRKQSIMDGQVKQVRGALEETLEEFRAVKRQQDAIPTLQKSLEDVLLEHATLDKELKDGLRTLSTALANEGKDVLDLRYSLGTLADQRNRDKEVFREVKETLCTIRKENEGLRMSMDQRLDLNRDKIAKLRDEFETRQLHVENQQNRFNDSLTNAHLVINHVQAELGLVATSAADAAAGVTKLWHEKASVKAIELHQKEYVEFSTMVDHRVLQLQQRFGTIVDSLKAHFQSALDTLGVVTAEQTQKLKQSYQQETAAVQAAVQAVDKLRQQAESMNEACASEIRNIKETMKQEASAFVENLGQRMQKQERESVHAKIEAGQLQKGLRELQSLIQAHEGQRLAQRDALLAIVEESFVRCALDNQDIQDRQNIALMGFKAQIQQLPLPVEKDGKPAVTTTLPELTGVGVKASPRRKLVEQRFSVDGIALPKTVTMELDKRCLSCCGTPAAVLTGFKLACLHYAPSPVEYGKTHHSRTELMQKRTEMLTFAREQLKLLE